MKGFEMNTERQFDFINPSDAHDSAEKLATKCMSAIARLAESDEDRLWTLIHLACRLSASVIVSARLGAKDCGGAPIFTADDLRKLTSQYSVWLHAVDGYSKRSP